MAAKHIRGAKQTLDYTASGAVEPGTVVSVGAKYGIYNGSKALASGDLAQVYVDGLWEIDVASGDTFTNTAPVDIDVSAQLAVPFEDADSDGYLGVAGKAKTSGQTTMHVWLNAPPVEPASA